MTDPPQVPTSSLVVPTTSAVEVVSESIKIVTVSPSIIENTVTIAPKAPPTTPSTRKRKSTKDVETSGKRPPPGSQTVFRQNGGTPSRRNARNGSSAEDKQPPILSPEKQVIADDESNTIFPPGARVFAIWVKAYYPAIVGDADGFGRYKVCYTEGHITRYIPKDGVIPLHLVKEGSLVSSLGEPNEDNERSVFVGRVSSIPSITDCVEWQRGVYTLRQINDDGTEEPEAREVKWLDMYLNENQGKQLIKSVKNFTSIDQGLWITLFSIFTKSEFSENVIERRRRTRGGSAHSNNTLDNSSDAPSEPSEVVGATATEVAPTSNLERTASNSEESTSYSQNPTPLREEVSRIFENIQFVVTSANSRVGRPPFSHKEFKEECEPRGGIVLEKFDDMDPNLPIYLLSDRPYKTLKYLMALSLSVPTVSSTWIKKCIEEVSFLLSEFWISVK